MGSLITVVTVVKNGEKYIQRCIESVLSQDTNLEYLIYDALSNDSTEKIIRKYLSDPRIKYYREQDKGPADALQKAFNTAQGDIYCWINADDYLLDGSLKFVAQNFMRNKEVNFIYGDYFTKSGETLKYKKKFKFNKEILFYRYMMMPQPSSFWRASIYEESGGLDPNFKFSFDYDLFLRMAHLKNFKALYIPKPFSVFELHKDQITAMGDKWFRVERHKAREKLRKEGRIIKIIRKSLATIQMYLYYISRVVF